MELKEYIRMEIEGLDRNLKRTVDTLKQEEIAWQPSSGCNSIGLILFHVAKSEDSFVQKMLNDKQELWETDEWFKKMELDAKEAGAHYTVEQVDAFCAPKLDAILEYTAAVRAQTLACLDSMQPADFERKIKVPWGEMPAIMIFSMIVGHATQHLGEVSYLRGLQRGMDK
jgi:uncharacterized damage-inducible protein DinB